MLAEIERPDCLHVHEAMSWKKPVSMPSNVEVLFKNKFWNSPRSRWLRTKALSQYDADLAVYNNSNLSSPVEVKVSLPCLEVDILHSTTCCLPEASS